jgi:acyl-[acyl-carrier-protein]-phospholipid O-acyltransferase/long-chain-fatty-acid--[acyl-carrier-protein] ligase
LGWSQEEAAALVVTGRPDEKKGESLVVVCERDIELEALRAPLQEQGLPNLWIPKNLIRVKEIPHLPTGKLDLCSVGKLAEQYREISD